MLIEMKEKICQNCKYFTEDKALIKLWAICTNDDLRERMCGEYAHIVRRDFGCIFWEDNDA